MALVLGSSQALSGARNALDEAIRDFRSILSNDDLAALQDIKKVPPEQAVMQFTAKLDATRRSKKGRSVASRLYTVLQTVRDFSTIVDTFISSRPEIAALVWGSIKMTMLIAVNFTSYFESLSDIFMKFRVHCPRFMEYQALYPSSTRLQTALCNFHTAIVRCCMHAVQVIQRSNQQTFLHALRQSLDQELRPDVDNVSKCGQNVKDEVALAKAQADAKDQALQREEREASSRSRQFLTRFISESKADVEERKRWQMQQDLRHSRERKRLLLEHLSSHDYLSPYKEACKMRHPGTADWISSTPEFKRWKESAAFSALWCSGKIGSGKTILTASAIDHILNESFDATHACVTFFFIRSDDPQSLKADTILRSVLKQSLDIQTLSEEMESALSRLDNRSYSSLDDLIELLRQRIGQFGRFHIFIDGADACERFERQRLFNGLFPLGADSSGLKVYWTNRETLPNELRGEISAVESLSMACSAAESDIELFVREELRNRIDRKDLVVGAASLIVEMESILTRHADGMFLWVRYLIDELCVQLCDADIRRCLGDLPRDLKGVYNRALSRIVSRRRDTVTQKAFSWVAAAKRRLTLEELRDAMSTEVCQPHSMPERQINGIESIATWSENLLQVDEEFMTVQFAHRSIFDFLTGQPSKHRISSVHVDLQDADHHCGEICMTYLSFNDFQTTLARSGPMHAMTPLRIAEAALGHHGKRLRLPRPFLGRPSDSRLQQPPFNVTETLASYKRGDGSHGLAQLQQSYPFLSYVTEHWILHTKDFSRKVSRTWRSWENAILEGHALAQLPWQDYPFNSDLTRALSWAVQARHKGLLRLEDIRHLSFHNEEVIGILATKKDLELLDVLLEDHVQEVGTSEGHRTASKVGRLGVDERILPKVAGTEHIPRKSNAFEGALQKASSHGYLQVMEKLIIAGAEAGLLRTEDDEGLGLLLASVQGDLQLVQQLLADGTDVDARPSKFSGRTALQVAVQQCHFHLIELLLAAGANVNAKPHTCGGQTALQTATEQGDLHIVERLLAAGADVNAEPSMRSGRTALQAAAEGGHIHIVERLLAAGADVNAEPSIQFGRTALQAAAEGGHLDIVERLLAAGAVINTEPSSYGGRTTLQAAAEQGHLHIVERLLAAGANINGKPSKLNGRTALQAAAEQGHLHIVERLVAAGADVNAQNDGWVTKTALQAAVENYHLHLLGLLLEAGAYVFPGCMDALRALPKPKREQVVKQLHARGIYIDTKPLSDEDE